jgi:hypothetical protein
MLKRLERTQRADPYLFENSIRRELDAAERWVEERNTKRREGGKQPLTDQARKRNFAEGLSRALAPRVASALRPRFVGIFPDEHGGRQESRARTAKGFKKLDVNYSTPELGLGLGVSIKTINFRDPATNRYTKNYTRADAELRAEASDYHDRQPYAVMIGIVFIPVDACDDGTDAPSSFGGAVQTFRFRAGRQGPAEPSVLFERVFIGLYEGTEPASRGQIGFFDVMKAPPRHGRPRSTLNFRQLIDEIIETYDNRNNPAFQWADAEPERVSPPSADEELDAIEEEGEDDEPPGSPQQELAPPEASGHRLNLQ